MGLKEDILSISSGAHVTRIAKSVIAVPNKVKELINLVLAKEEKVAKNAAWVLSHVSDVKPDIVLPHSKKLIENLGNSVHDAVKRNTIRVLQFVDIPDELLGMTADVCFRYAKSADEAIAIKVFSLTVLANICKKEPGLANELKLIIEAQLPFAKPAFISRGKKILKSLSKLS